MFVAFLGSKMLWLIPDITPRLPWGTYPPKFSCHIDFFGGVRPLHRNLDTCFHGGSHPPRKLINTFSWGGSHPPWKVFPKSPKYNGKFIKMEIFITRPLCKLWRSPALFCVGNFTLVLMVATRRLDVKLSVGEPSETSPNLSKLYKELHNMLWRC